MKRRTTARVSVALLGLATACAACAADPEYLQPQLALEVNAPGAGEDAVGEATAQVLLPIELEDEEDLADRTAEAESTGIPFDALPYVRLGDLSVSVEWTLRNLTEEDGVAFVNVNGANEFFAFDPALLDIAPDDDDVVPPPPLVGNVPILVPALATLSGVIREDEIDEASIDLELISRGGANIVGAILDVNEGASEFVDTASGLIFTRDQFAGLVRVDVTFVANRHMVLEFAVRVRDHRGLLHEDLLEAVNTDPGLLQPFAPVPFVPAVDDTMAP